MKSKLLKVLVSLVLKKQKSWKQELQLQVIKDKGLQQQGNQESKDFDCDLEYIIL